MTTVKKKTINTIKETRTVSTEARQRRKNYADKKKQILKALEDEPKTIPELTSITGMPDHEVTYYLMTLRKYGDVVVGEVDDDDEYFYYQLKKSS